MAITDTGGGAVNNTNNAATYATASFTPAANDLLLTLGGISDTALAAALTDSVDGAQTIILSRSFTSGVPMMMYAHVGTGLVAASSRTMTYDVTGDNGTGAHMTVRRLQNTRSALPFIRQFATATGASGTTPTVVLPRPCLTGNAVFGIVIAGLGVAIVSPPSGWSEILDQSHNTPPMTMEYARILSGETGQTITWGSTVSADWAAAVVEVYETSVAPDFVRLAHHHRQMMMGER